MSAPLPSDSKFRVSSLSQNTPSPFEIRPNAPALAQIAQEMGLDGLRKLSFKGQIIADGKNDWRLDARLGATVIQPCVVTLAPVTTRIEEDVTRRFISDFSHPDEPEVEMPDDDNSEKLGTWIDPEAIMIEALTLALPLYPRADEAALGSKQYAAPGVTPMRDEDAKPFAGLAGLRDALGGASPKDGDSGED
ncbi:MAG: YceD family protein [Sulfitobacter sp.]